MCTEMYFYPTSFGSIPQLNVGLMDSHPSKNVRRIAPELLKFSTSPSSTETVKEGSEIYGTTICL